MPSFALEALGTYLSEAGSAWTVTREPHWSLVRRVQAASHDQVVAVADRSRDAGRLLREAWHKCYRHHPDYDGAYDDAVEAVEAVAIDALIPNDTDATLGKAIGHLRNTADRWIVGGLDHAEPSSSETLLSMLSLLWRNQPRHAGSDVTASRPVTASEAETAVNMAVTLVQWFSAGLVRRKDN
jgi:hypothetical protein